MYCADDDAKFEKEACGLLRSPRYPLSVRGQPLVHSFFMDQIIIFTMISNILSSQ